MNGLSPEASATGDLNHQSRTFSMDSSTSLDGPNASPGTSAPRPKGRISRACTACSKVKLRCDGGQPCGRCVSIGASDCTYLPSMRGKTRRRRQTFEDGPVDKKSKSRIESDDASDAQEDPIWRHGVVMNDRKLEFDRWKQDEALNESLPRNSALWHSPASTYTAGQPGDDTIPDKLTTLPLPGDAHNPLAVLAEASGQSGKHSPLRRGKHLLAEERVSSEEGKGFYSPLARSLRDDAPHVMSLISVNEAEQLFNAYFKFLHPHLPVLDREHSSPAALAQRNNFLFNAICCVSARSFNVMLWNRLQEFARFEMERLPKEKNIDVVQGHLIYSVWNIITPTSFEQDKSWIRIGHAIRTAMDINLHRVALVKAARDGLPDWLVRMIIRTWLLGCIIDRTLGAQLGKPTMLRGESSVQGYTDLLRNGKRSMDDAWVAALSEWSQVMARVHDVFGSDSADFPVSRAVSSQLPDMAFVFESQFRQWSEKSIGVARISDNGDTRASDFVIARIRLYEHYARLVTHSFALQKAIETQTDLPAVFAKYQNIAMRLIDAFETEFEGKGFTRGCPDFVYTTLTFAAVSLLKGTQAQFAHLEPDRAALLSLARKAADILARTATTSDHLPASQHAFISRLIDKRSAEPQPLPTTLQPMDFQAFGQSIDQDLSKTPWPPAPMGTRPNLSDTTPTGNDAFSWLTADAFSVPEAALGVGLGNSLQDQDLLFTQDSFWKSILEGSHDPTLV